MEFQLVKTLDDQVDEMYTVLQATAVWLDGQGRRQRIAKTRLATFLQWQRAGCNYLVRTEDRVAGILALPVEEFADWPEFRPLGQAVWLRALATHPDFRGHGVGAYAIEQSLQLVGRGTPLYLDCVSDFLPDYYARHGFRVLSEQTKTFPDGDVFAITLMRHDNE